MAAGTNSPSKCKIVSDDFSSFLQSQGIPIQLAKNSQFPLVCSDNGLRIHPDLLSEECTWQKLYSNIVSQYSQSVLESKIKFLAKGAFGKVYKIGDRNYVIKHQQIEINDFAASLMPSSQVQTSIVKEMNNQPVVALEEQLPMQPKVALVDQMCIIESLALYALNRWEEEHGSFVPNQTHCVPQIHYTALLFNDKTWHSLIFLEYLEGCVPFYDWEAMQLKQNQYYNIAPMVLKIGTMFQNMERSSVALHHFDAHQYNIMVNPVSNQVFLLDFGMVHFLMPLSYFCPTSSSSLISINRFCVSVGNLSFVPFKYIKMFVRLYNIASFVHKSQGDVHVTDLVPLLLQQYPYEQEFAEEYILLLNNNNNNKWSTAYDYLKILPLISAYENKHNTPSTSCQGDDYMSKNCGIVSNMSKEDEQPIGNPMGVSRHTRDTGYPTCARIGASRSDAEDRYRSYALAEREAEASEPLFGLMSATDRDRLRYRIQQLVHSTQFIDLFFDKLKEKPVIYSLLFHQYSENIDFTKKQITLLELSRAEWYKNNYELLFVSRDIRDVNIEGVLTIPELLNRMKMILDFESRMHDDLMAFMDAGNEWPEGQARVVYDFMGLFRKFEPTLRRLLSYQNNSRVDLQEFTLWSHLFMLERTSPNFSMFSRSPFTLNLRDACVLAKQYKFYQKWKGWQFTNDQDPEEEYNDEEEEKGNQLNVHQEEYNTKFASLNQQQQQQEEEEAEAPGIYDKYLDPNANSNSNQAILNAFSAIFRTNADAVRMLEQVQQALAQMETRFQLDIQRHREQALRNINFEDEEITNPNDVTIPPPPPQLVASVVQIYAHVFILSIQKQYRNIVELFAEYSGVFPTKTRIALVVQKKPQIISFSFAIVFQNLNYDMFTLLVGLFHRKLASRPTILNTVFDKLVRAMSNARFSATNNNTFDIIDISSNNEEKYQSGFAMFRVLSEIMGPFSTDEELTFSLFVACLEYGEDKVLTFLIEEFGMNPCLTYSNILSYVIKNTLQWTDAMKNTIHVLFAWKGIECLLKYVGRADPRPVFPLFYAIEKRSVFFVEKLVHVFRGAGAHIHKAELEEAVRGQQENHTREMQQIVKLLIDTLVEDADSYDDSDSLLNIFILCVRANRLVSIKRLFEKRFSIRNCDDSQQERLVSCIVEWMIPRLKTKNTTAMLSIFLEDGMRPEGILGYASGFLPFSESVSSFQFGQREQQQQEPRDFQYILENVPQYRPDFDTTALAAAVYVDRYDLFEEFVKAGCRDVGHFAFGLLVKKHQLVRFMKWRYPSLPITNEKLITPAFVMDMLCKDNHFPIYEINTLQWSVKHSTNKQFNSVIYALTTVVPRKISMEVMIQHTAQTNSLDKFFLYMRKRNYIDVNESLKIVMDSNLHWISSQTQRVVVGALLMVGCEKVAEENSFFDKQDSTLVDLSVLYQHNEADSNGIAEDFKQWYRPIDDTSDEISKKWRHQRLLDKILKQADLTRDVVESVKSVQRGLEQDAPPPLFIRLIRKNLYDNGALEQMLSHVDAEPLLHQQPTL